MFRRALLLSVLILIFCFASGQTFKQQFNDLANKKDTAGQTELLRKWELTDKNDPELYVAYFNFYVNKARKEVIELGQNPKGGTILEMQNTDTSKKEPYYMYSNISYDSVLLNKGFEYADKGIDKNPTRLDIRFGKVYMFGELKDYKNFTEEIIKTIEYSAVINNKWIWADNKPVDDPKKFMLNSIQDYQVQLYNTNDDNLLDNMKRIGETVLKYYPDHVESLSNVSIVHLIKKEYDQALELLLKAEKLAPTDFIILSNIARTYQLKGDAKNAIKYYEQTIKYGDQQAIDNAKSQIKEINNK